MNTPGNRTRHRAGQPVGGQFAIETRAGAGVSLTYGARARSVAWLEHEVQRSNQDCWLAGQRVDALSGGVCAELIWSRFPKATGLALEASDQGDFYEGREIMTTGGSAIGHWADDESDEDEAIYLSNLNCYQRHPFVDTSTGNPTLDLAAARQAAKNAGSVAGGFAGRVHEVKSAQVHWRGTVARNESLSARLVAATLVHECPAASHLVLDASDQGDFWDGVAVLDAGGNHVADWDDESLLDSDAHVALSNLNCFADYPYINQDAGGRWLLDVKSARQAAH